MTLDCRRPGSSLAAKNSIEDQATILHVFSTSDIKFYHYCYYFIDFGFFFFFFFFFSSPPCYYNTQARHNTIPIHTINCI